jgi:hypothetical protein
MKVNRLQLLCILLLLLGGCVVRLYRFNNPIADWHSWRQADTSAVSRDFVQNGFDVLHPTFEDISNIPSGKENPHGYRFVEFPLYNVFQAGLYKTIGVFTLEEWGRLVTIFFSLLGSLFLFLLVKRRGYALAAWFTFIISLFIPYNIYYGRTILPDTAMVATLLAGVFFLDKWLDGFRKKQSPHIFFLLLSFIFTTSSFLLKAYTLFYGITFIVLLFSVLKFSMFKRWELYCYAILSMLPLIAWRKYMLAYPEGIPVNAWLFNGNGIRFRPSFFRWLFYERLTKLIAGYSGVLFLISGVIQMWKEKKDMLFLLSFPLSSLVYMCIIATGNVQHDYYQIVVMPSVALLMGFGAAWVTVFLQKFVNKTSAYGIVIVALCISFWFGWQQIKDYFNINNPSLVIAGHVVDTLTPKDAKIIAPYGGDTSFLYQTKRKGWPSFEHDIPDLITLGADYLVFVNPQKSDYAFAKTYKIVASSSQYLLFDLHKNP